MIGPLLAAWLLARGVPLRDIFLWAIVRGVITLTLALAIREPPQPVVPRVPF